MRPASPAGCASTPTARPTRTHPDPGRGLDFLYDAGRPGKWWGLVGQGSGQVWCWGQNALGQLGDGTQEDRVSPVQSLP